MISILNDDGTVNDNPTEEELNHIHFGHRGGQYDQSCYPKVMKLRFLVDGQKKEIALEVIRNVEKNGRVYKVKGERI